MKNKPGGIVADVFASRRQDRQGHPSAFGPPMKIAAKITGVLLGFPNPLTKDLSPWPYLNLSPPQPSPVSNLHPLTWRSQRPISGRVWCETIKFDSSSLASTP